MLPYLSVKQHHNLPDMAYRGSPLNFFSAIHQTVKKVQSTTNNHS